MTASEETEARIREAFAAAGVRGWLHARDVTRAGGPAVDGPAAAAPTAAGPAAAGQPGEGLQIDVDAEDAVPLASVYKVALLVAFCRAVDDGVLDPTEPLTVGVDDRTAGPTGLSIMLDPVTMSLRDLAASMTSVSDNAAADALLRRIGTGRVAADLAALGLARTTVARGTAEVYDELGDELGAPSTDAALAALADNDRAADPSAYDPLHASASTAREMTTLLAALWDDTAASPDQCRFARRLLGRRLTTTRIASGFPYDEVRTAGKTGTLGALRHEVGVVEFPGEPPVAVAVFTRAARADRTLPRADAVIGEAARLAVAALRLARV